MANTADKYMPQDSVPLPPPDAKMVTTACDYCIVGCGYRVFTWPEGTEGGPRASENALGMDLPTNAFQGWVSPNQHNFVTVDGQRHHVVVQPDPEADVVNRNGNHSIRGGTLALKAYNPDTLTRDRLKTPLLRVNGELTPVSWDVAYDIMARVSEYVLANHGESAWGMKTYSYEYFENIYAISKLAFRSIGTPAYSPHDKPGPGNDTAGLEDSGIIPFSASFEDWSEADVIADIVLPAATWGEETFSRCNGERRLRLYSQFYDPPGESMPDWKIIAGFARRMGFEGYDWEHSKSGGHALAYLGQWASLGRGSYL